MLDLSFICAMGYQIHALTGKTFYYLQRVHTNCQNLAVGAPLVALGAESQPAHRWSIKINDHTYSKSYKYILQNHFVRTLLHISFVPVILYCLHCSTIAPPSVPIELPGAPTRPCTRYSYHVVLGHRQHGHKNG